MIVLGHPPWTIQHQTRSDVTPAPHSSMSAETDTSTMAPWSSGNVVAFVQTAKPGPTQNTAAPFPSPKTGKPRPHVCATCTRSFARLEHLNRHERCHTKEKPFECPQCTRCFARQDLVLRHQRKLHQQGATSPRPRTGRRKSTTGLPPSTTSRARKNSVASSVSGAVRGAGTASMRPRANTISHIDPSTLNNFLASHNASFGRVPGIHPGHSHHANPSGLDGPGGFDYQGMSTSIGNHGQAHGLQTLDTHLGLDLGGTLRTAPIQGFGPDDLELEKFFGSSGLTIDRNQSHHFSGSMKSAFPFNPFDSPFTGTNSIEEDDLGWSADLENPMVFP